MNKQRYFQKGIIGEVNGAPSLIGHKCGDCGKRSFPPTELCPYCASERVEDVFLGDEATVLAATTTRAGVPPYKPPFTLAIVDIDDDIRTIGRIEKDDQVKVKKGDKLALRIGKLWEESEFNKETKTNEPIDVIGYYYVLKN